MTSFIFISLSHSLSASQHHGFSVFDKLKYPENFKHFDYHNPDAPKGGRLTMGVLGTFDSLNPFIVKGNPAAGLILTHAMLGDEPHDRAGEIYGYLAEKIEIPEDRSWLVCHLNPKAVFSDGHPITADDVIWTFETLKEKGLPHYRSYYLNVSKVERLSDHAVKFHFNSTTNRELPLIVGQLMVLPKHFYESVAFGDTTLKAAPSSGPYKIKRIDPGRSITYERVKGWWGENVPSQRGSNNFDEITFEYYLDDNAMLEAFKTGKLDWRREATIRLWKTAYDFPARTAGLVKMEELKSELTAPTYGFFFNTRRELFQDVRVRKALSLVFDFAWANKNLFYNAYKRNYSYYPNSLFAAKGSLPDDERELLEPYKDKLPPALFSEAFTLPDQDDPAHVRAFQQQALQLLNEAGWVIENQVLVNGKTKTPFVFEIINSNKNLEKVFLNFAQSLKRLGITLKIRTLDTSTYVNRVESLDFEMIFAVIPQSPSLGNEQRDFFGSERADAQGTRNYAGVKNPVVDELIESLIKSPTYPELCLRSRALDRVLLFNYYMIPAWHSDVDRVAYWDKFDRPELVAKFNPVDFRSWWYNPEKAKTLESKKKNDVNGSVN